jgi:hypothetical protein
MTVRQKMTGSPVRVQNRLAKSGHLPGHPPLLMPRLQGFSLPIADYYLAHLFSKGVSNVLRFGPQ